jgi:orotidine-5'-phosphate decarboxylase
VGLSLPVNHSIIPACDSDFDRYEDVIRATHDLERVSAYKLGASLCLRHGLDRVVIAAREFTNKPLIYDHQKAGTDIPETAHRFMETIKSCGIDAVILFPLAGPETQTAWIASAQAVGLSVIVGGYMTHSQFTTSEGGYILPEAIDRIYTLAATNGVSDFVVPGNKPDVIRRLRSFLPTYQAEFAFFAPGFIRQGGKLSEAARVAGPRWHAIVGRALYESSDIRGKALSLLDRL